jgi:hypothetical protein
VGDRAVAHPADQRLLDLDHHHLLHARVREDPLEGVAEAESSDDDVTGVVDQLERGPGELGLGAGLLCVHHEHAVDPQLQDVGRAFLDPAAQHELSAFGLGARHLGVLGDDGAPRRRGSRRTRTTLGHEDVGHLRRVATQGEGVTRIGGMTRGVAIVVPTWRSSTRW